MTKSQANSYGGVRKKLMGAVAMLLVASIMVVSSTYAWFTLSTAPEITGISTSVGANGNLEIALLNSDTAKDMTTITSAVGDSSDATGRTVSEANVTWGNLVDLSDSSYGTGSFVLNPARLNASVSGEGENISRTLNTTNVLLTAKYGNDGRVSELAANTVSGTYSTAKAAFVDSGVGVRGIGVAAAMTAEQLALRNAVAQVALNTNNAKVGISNALTSNGSKLASLAMSYANDANYEPTEGDITAINSVRVSVSDAKNLLGNAIRYAMMAESLSKSSEASKKYEDYVLTSTDGYSESIAAAVEKLNAIPTVAEANADNLKTVLDTLIDTNTMTINGFTTAQTRNDANASALASKVMSDGGLKVVLPSTGASAFARVADMTGNFSANITIETLSHNSIALTNVKASMATAMEGTYAMANVGSAIAGLSAAASTTVTPGDTVITDMYGYAVDFAVRTNAAGSNLLLQVEEAQRIYSDGDNVSTQGGGSYMQFTKGSDLTEDQFRDLLGAVRVVFTDGSSSNNIKMVAVLDVANAVADAEENAGEDASISGAKIRLLPVEYSIAAATGNTAGMLTVTKNESGAYVALEDKSIMALEQNTPAKVTATVYLDGDIVDNSMVSATAARSMTGTMNLQFASSAALVPMDYTPLHSMDAQQNTGSGSQNTDTSGT